MLPSVSSFLLLFTRRCRPAVLMTGVPISSLPGAFTRKTKRLKKGWLEVFFKVTGLRSFAQIGVGKEFRVSPCLTRAIARRVVCQRRDRWASALDSSSSTPHWHLFNVDRRIFSLMMTMSMTINLALLLNWESVIELTPRASKRARMTFLVASIWSDAIYLYWPLSLECVCVCV